MMKFSTQPTIVLLGSILLLSACSVEESDTEVRDVDQTLSKFEAIEIEANKARGMYQRIDAATLVEFKTIFDEMLDMAQNSSPQLAANCMDLLINRWQELDPQSLSATALADTRCFDLGFGRNLIPLVLKYNAAEFLEYCRSAQASDLVAYAASLESPLQLEFIRMALRGDGSDSTFNLVDPLLSLEPEHILRKLGRNLLDGDDLTARKMTLLTQLSEESPMATGLLVVSILNQRPDLASELSPVFRLWALKDPIAAFETAESAQSYSVVNTLFEAVILEWSDYDPLAALNFARERIGATGIRQNLMTKALSGWMSIDPTAAGAFVFALPQSEIRSLSKALEPWVRQNPEQAMAEIAEQLDSLRAIWVESSSHQKLIGFWADQHLSAATDWALQLPPGRVRNHYLLELTRRQSQHPEVATHLIEKITETWAREEATKSLLRYWAAEDPRSALQWLGRLPPEHRQLDLEVTIFETWAQEDVLSAAKSMPKFGDLYREELVGEVAKAYFEQDRFSALKWVETLPEENQSHAYTMIAGYLIRREAPEVVIDFFEEIGIESISIRVVNRFARKYGSQDPRAALEWSLSLPPITKTRGSAISVALFGYLKSEPNYVENWAQTLEVGTVEHDAAAYACSLHFYDLDPVKAAHYGTKIRDTRRRNTAFGTIFWNESRQRKQSILDEARKSGGFSQRELEILQHYAK
ncbi:MAG: hypothetical protein ACLFUF_04110 [Opitutales bacterium]